MPHWVKYATVRYRPLWPGSWALAAGTATASGKEAVAATRAALASSVRMAASKRYRPISVKVPGGGPAARTMSANVPTHREPGSYRQWRWPRADASLDNTLVTVR